MLSIVSVTAPDVVTLPALSVATTCSFSEPSGSVVVLSVELAASQVDPPSVEYSYATEAIPEPFDPFGSLVEDVNVMVPRTYPPAVLGSFIVAFGDVLSTSLFVTGVELAWLPATSTATVRRS